MLVLARKPGERIRIGDNVVITLTRISGNTARIGIDAPDDVLILREELWSVPREDTGSDVSDEVCTSAGVLDA